MEMHVTIDCTNAEALADFYCKALGYTPEAAAGQYRVIAASDGRPKLVFQQVGEPKPAAKNRIHLDLIVGPDIEAEAERCVTLGATRIGPVSEFGMHWIVMHDPEGNELCICDS